MDKRLHSFFKVVLLLALLNTGLEMRSQDVSITSHPSSTSVCTGNNATFSVAANNAQTYQWQVNQGAGYLNIANVGKYSGANTASLSITNATANMSGYTFRCLMTGIGNPAVTTPASLTVQNIPAFTQNPFAAAICEGDAVLFYVAASSTTSYQWQVNDGSGFVNISNGTGPTGGIYSGAQSAVIIINNAAVAMSGYAYRCVISGNCASNVPSLPATFTVYANVTYYEDYDGDGYGNGSVTTISCNGAPWGFVTNSNDCNDNNPNIYPGAVEICGDGIDNNCDGNIDEGCEPASIASHPSSSTICAGNDTTFSITADYTTGYQWQVNTGSGFAAVGNGGVYSGADTATLTLTGAGSGMNGYSYRCVANGNNASQAVSNPATLTVQQAPAITQNPFPYATCEGNASLFYIASTSTTAYQWQVDNGSGYANVSNGAGATGGNYSGANSSVLIISNATSAMSGYTYRCVVSGPCTPSASSLGALLTIDVNVTYYEDYDGDGYGNGWVTTTSCNGAPWGFVSNSNDCDDYDPNIHPGAVEICGDGIDNNCDGNVDEDCFCTAVALWDGNAWFPSQPSADMKAVFTGDYTSTADLDVCNVQVSGNAVVTVASGHNLIVSGEVSVSPGAQLVFNNGANLLQDPLATSNSNTGSLTFRKDSNALYNLDYTIWSSPTSGTQTLKDFSPGTLDANFFVYNTALSAYSNYLSASGIFGGNPNAVTFTSGKGYLVRMPAGLPTGSTSVFNGTFEGTPNNGDISIALSNQGGRFNAVGNPYPSPISIRDFIDANQAQMDNGTLYFWRKTNLAQTATYVTVTNMGSAAVDEPSDSSGSFTGNPSTWVIQPGQGFLFKASTTATELSFNNTMRRASGNGQFFRSGATANELSRLWLDISNNSTSFGQAVIGYSDATTNGLDFGWDGRLYNDSDLSIYTKAEATKLAIQARAPFTTDDAVPVSYKANNAGTFTLKMSAYDGLFAGDQQVYLKDNVFNIYHDLKAGAYTFSSEAGTFEDRFEVVYLNAALGTDNPAFDANNVIIYKEGSTLKIDAGNVSMKQVDIFDIRGRLLHSAANVNATTLAISDLSVAQQVLIVQITSEDNSRTSKKIIY